ncbi:MAG: sugar ABC transporter ATP-binding protein [Spirochaetales bacterium]|jgi:ribose transport system ATP-binding protein/inositol transport system ATP-binding protein|nr:sugar ABC transporter ATP-binding protein [Spirochaetales bacterium]
MTDNLVLEMRGIKKRFTGVQALKGVDFQLKKGEVHALLGENGAGKSTMIKVLGGIYHADAGEIYLNGQQVKIQGARDAQEKKISIIHQEIVLVPHISVAENIFLGREPSKLGMKRSGEMNRRAQEMVAQLGLDIDVREEVCRFPLAQRQMVEIVKAVSFDAQIIVMDEPTSSLTEYEVAQLFSIIKKLKERKISIIYISHKLNELTEIADRVTILRDGSYIGTLATRESSQDQWISMMVNRTLDKYYTHTKHPTRGRALEVKDLTRHGVFENISFHVDKGEVVGFAGLVGAGRSEVMRSVFGVDPYDSGVIELEGKPVTIAGVWHAMSMGLAMLPEDRKKEGLMLKHSVGFNLTLTVLGDFLRGISLNTAKRQAIIDEYVKALSIKTPSAETLAINLSGGNQQKVALAKWLATKPKALILDEPTRGIDVGAKAEIYSIIDTLASEGIAVVIVSSELPEVINMSDRIYVMEQGKMGGELFQKEYTQEKIMYYATRRSRK